MSQKTILDYLPRHLVEGFELRIMAEEMTRAAGVHPEVLEHLRPGPLRGKHRALYQAHVAEILERADTKVTLDVATVAEVTLACSNASLAAPPNHAGALLYDRVFFAVFGRRFGDAPREEWPGQADELLAEARRKVPTGRPRVRVRKHRQARRLP